MLSPYRDPIRWFRCHRAGELFCCVLLSILCPAAWAQQAPRQPAPKAVLWQDPGDIGSRNLLDGPGGAQHRPDSVMTFVEEDLSGSTPKFKVRDRGGVEWKAKLGLEARPEVAASHLLWAVGFFTDEDYFLPTLELENAPAALVRGGESWIQDGRIVNAVRLERISKHKKLGYWKWKQNPFRGTREFNGLRVMMALLNNWDVKDENNAIYLDPDGIERYEVSDLGATFGTINYTSSDSDSKSNLPKYKESKFLTRIRPAYVNFGTPGARPFFPLIFHLPSYIKRLHLRWIGRHIPRADAKWMGSMLARLSPQQIRDAFRAAGYSETAVEGFAEVLEKRIAELNQL